MSGPIPDDAFPPITQFPTEDVAERCVRLEVGQGIAFAASCCERLVSGCVAFQSVEKWGRVAVLERALDLAWRRAVGETVRGSAVDSATARLERAIPDTEEFPSLYGTLACNAGLATLALLALCRECGLDRIFEVMGYVYESIDAYLWDVNDLGSGPGVMSTEVESWLLRSPLYTRDLELQRHTLEPVMCLRRR